MTIGPEWERFLRGEGEWRDIPLELRGELMLGANAFAKRKITRRELEGVITSVTRQLARGSRRGAGKVRL